MKIVILDDSLTIRMIIESLLDELGVKDDKIFSFASGVDAIEFIKSNGADIIFSDINMPEMDGYEFAEKVFEILPKLKSSFFAVSGDETRESFLKMKKSGVNRFIKKPISVDYFRHFVLPEILKLKLKVKS